MKNMKMKRSNLPYLINELAFFGNPLPCLQIKSLKLTFTFLGKLTKPDRTREEELRTARNENLKHEEA